MAIRYGLMAVTHHAGRFIKKQLFSSAMPSIMHYTYSAVYIGYYFAKLCIFFWMF